MSGRRWLLAVVCLSRFVIVLDGLITVVALPAIQRDLGLDSAALSRVVTVYAIAVGGFLLLAGRAGDIIGRRPLFVAGALTFSASSLICGLAETEATLLAGRALQGLGGAMMTPTGLGALVVAFPAMRERTAAIAYWGIASALAGSSGLLLGGLLTDLASWRWIFFVSFPLGLLIALSGLRLVPRTRHVAAPRWRGFDIGGALTVTGGIALLVLSTAYAQQQGWLASQTLLAAAAGAVLLAAFASIERRHPAPLVRPAVFRVRALALANWVVICSSGISASIVYLTAICLQEGLGYSPLACGLALVPTGPAVLAGSLAVRRLRPRFDLLNLIIAALCLAAGGALLLLRIGPGASYLADIAPGLVVVYFAMGALTVGLTLFATEALEPNESGLVTGLIATSHQIGVALWVTVTVTIVVGLGEADPAGLLANFRFSLLLDAGLALAVAASSALLRPAS